MLKKFTLNCMTAIQIPTEVSHAVFLIYVSTITRQFGAQIRYSYVFICKKFLNDPSQNLILSWPDFKKKDLKDT